MNAVDTVRQANIVGVDRQAVVDELNAISKTYSGMQSSPFGKLIILMAEAPRFKDRTHTVREIVNVLQPALMRTSSFEQKSFKQLVQQHPFMMQDMYYVVFGWNILPGRLRSRLELAKIAHDYYGVQKEYLFLFAVTIFGRYPNATAAQGSAELASDVEAVKQWMIWCMTKNVVAQLVNAKNLAGEFLGEIQSSINQGIPPEDIISSVMFRTFYDILPYNIMYTPVNGAPVSLGEVLAPNNADPATCYVISVMYPALGVAAPETITSYNVLRNALAIALRANASLDQMEQIYPSAIQRPLGVLRQLDVDLIRVAARHARLDIMQAYGFGPSFLAYLEAFEIPVQKFLQSCSPAIRQTVSQILGLAQSSQNVGITTLDVKYG